MQRTTDTPRIYAACLASYNAGRLHGEWIDCDADADEIADEIAAMLAASPEPNAEEYAIHDHEGFPAGAIGEYSSVEEIAEIAAAIEEHGDAYRAALAIASDHADALAYVEDAYRGAWDSPGAFVEDYHEQCGDVVPHWLVVDWAATWRASFDCDGWHAVRLNGENHIFSPR